MKTLNSCGCCDGVSKGTPLRVSNRPGLSAIEYRIGEHPDFKSSLLAKLSKSDLTGLRQLTSRSDDDFSIALLDAFSTVADVLTFYQERIANESYLHTATEQVSIIELARLIGYELSPGVAANTYLSFTIDDKSLRPGQEVVSGMKSGGNERPIVNIARGTRVQSIPEQDEAAQFFETTENIKGKSDWNAMELRTFMPQAKINEDIKSLYIKGLNNNLKSGDYCLIINEDGDKIKKKIYAVHLLEDMDLSRLVFQQAPITYKYDVPLLNDYQLSAGYYNTRKKIGQEIVNDLILGDAINQDKSVSSRHLKSVGKIQNWNNYELRVAINSSKKSSAHTDPKLYVFRKRASLFGYNTPTTFTVTHIDETDPPHEHDENVQISTDNLPHAENHGKITLDSEYPEIVPGDESFIAYQKNQFEDAVIYKIDGAEIHPVSKYGLSGKSTELELSNFPAWDKKAKLSSIRNITVHAQNEILTLSQVPIMKPLAQETTDLFLSRFYIDLEIGQQIIIVGELEDIPSLIRSELHTIKKVYLQEGLTRIILDRPLENTFIRKTVRINANVALASHGETVNEILGSGNAAAPFQKFILKNSPLTYTSGSSTTGIETSLEIRINEVLWSEVTSLYQKKADDHIYITRQNSEGQTTVIFGDGVNGARLPTGTQNIRAVYRKGIGQTGLLKSNQLSQLVTRPLHLKAVNNPLAPEGAQDGEKLTDARSNANLTMYTLDRIVSLQDYEDFARAFAGIVKSKAIWMWTASGKSVHITIAGVNGEEVKPDSLLFNNLHQALSQSAFPGTSVKIGNYLKKYFVISGNLKVDPLYTYQTVHDKVISELSDKFSFSQRNLGQDVTLSEVITVIQSVEGVIYIDIDALHFVESTPSGEPEKRLVAHMASSGTTAPKPAELAILQPTPFEFNKI